VGKPGGAVPFPGCPAAVRLRGHAALRPRRRQDGSKQGGSNRAKCPPGKGAGKCATLSRPAGHGPNLAGLREGPAAADPHAADQGKRGRLFPGAGGSAPICTMPAWAGPASAKGPGSLTSGCTSSTPARRRCTSQLGAAGWIGLLSNGPAPALPRRPGRRPARPPPGCRAFPARSGAHDMAAWS